MWLLTCDGDLFEGKRIWLRPGSTHLLGRTTARAEHGENIRYIDHKSVSRKHLTITASAVKAGDSAKLFTRSEIKVKDGSKLGTTLNGHTFRDETKMLDGKEYTIKLGSYEHLFHLIWLPVTLSFTSGSKHKESILAERRGQFEQADIKVIGEYVQNETSHAFAKKRNTSAALQALIQARWLVADAFADALAEAVSTGGSDGTSLLEQDFDANWPKELDYAVPPAKEPQPRPAEYLRPDPNRAEVFQDYIFVFIDQEQHDMLLPVITAGSGKALMHAVEPGKTSVTDFVEFVKEVAGKKDSRQFRLSQHTGSGGVVLVRLNDGRDETSRNFMRNVDIALDQRSIEQSEFLDAILTTNASCLRQPLKDEDADAISDTNENAKSFNSRSTDRHRHEPPEQRAVSITDSPPVGQEAQRPGEPSQEPTASEDPQNVEQQPAEVASGAARRRNRRIITQSRFKGFDDFDPSQFSKPVSGSPEAPANSVEPSQAPNFQSMDVDEPSVASRTQNNARKRPLPDDVEEEVDIYATILPSHAAMKRQKTEAARNGEKDTLPISAVEVDNRSLGKTAKSKKKGKELDVMAEMQAKRQKQEEQRRQDEESLRDALQGIDINELKNLAHIEEMEVPVRDRASENTGASGRSNRWDPAWNGRKNFKKFRRQGAHEDGPRLPRVIVPLEEVPRKGRGIGDEYWLSSASTNRSKSKSQSQSQNPCSERTDNQESNETAFRRRLQKSREEDAEDEDASSLLPDEIAGRGRDRTIENAVNSTPSQTFATDSQRKTAGKRPAAQQDGGPAKRARQTTLAAPRGREVTNRDDDDEGLKFRRRR